MAKYVLNKCQETDRNSYRAIASLPLLIITVFCFSFILMQHPAHKQTSASSKQSSPAHSSITTALPQITSNTAPTLSKLDQAPIPTTVAPVAATPMTTTPQPVAATQTTSLQAATQNKATPTTTTTQAKPMTVSPVSNLVKTVTNALKK